VRLVDLGGTESGYRPSNWSSGQSIVNLSIGRLRGRCAGGLTAESMGARVCR
jgi:hypothetical protein